MEPFNKNSKLNVLITRLSHIGDCVLTLPLANALREQFPQAKIVWAAEAPSDQFLSTHNSVDEVVRIPKGWLKSPAKWFSVRHQLQQQRIDLAIDPQGLTKSAMLGWLSGARTRIGLRRPWSGELAPYLYTATVQPKQEHIVPRTLQLLGPLGVKKVAARFDFPVENDSLIKIDEFIARAHLGCGIAVINPGASWPSKLWEPDRFGSVAKQLGQQFGLSTVIVWAGEKEKSLAQQVLRHSGGHAIVAPRTNLKELAALCYRARLFISSDSGPLHMAVACGTPCVGLYGATQPTLCGAFGDNSVNIQKKYHAGSRTQRRKANNAAMCCITSEDVIQECSKLLRRAEVPRKVNRKRAA